MKFKLLTLQRITMVVNCGEISGRFLFCVLQSGSPQGSA